jgi:hypothetical protein
MSKTATTSKESALALYADFDLDALDEDKEETKKHSSSKRLGALPEGKTVLRMLPARKGSSHAPKPWIKMWQHRVEIPGLDKPVFIVCPRMHAKAPCRVCTTAKRMEASQNPVDQDRAFRLLPMLNFVTNVVKRGAEEDGVKLWQFGKKVHEQLQVIRDADQGEGKNFTHLTEGYDLMVIRKGTALKTTYTVRTAQGTSPLAADAVQMNEILQQGHNLDALIVVPSDEEIEDMLQGRAPQRREGRSAPRSSGPSASDRIYGEGKMVEDDE